MTAARRERLARIGFWVGLIAGWVVSVYYMWDAMTTVPSAERLEASKLVAIPSPRTFFTAAIFSALELGLVLVALWPWRPGYYASRLAVAALALITWFITTTPVELSRMDWVHRRWLAFTTAAVLAALAVLLLYRLARRLTERAGTP